MAFWNMIEKIRTRRLAHIEDLESQIVALEEARDEQLTINAEIRAEHEAELRKRTHKAEDLERKHAAEVERLKAKQQALDEETGHLMKIRDEKRDIELERKKVAMERERDAAIEKIRTEYQKKIEDHLNGRIADLGKMYAELLTRLPNIDVALKGRVGGN